MNDNFEPNNEFALAPALTPLNGTSWSATICLEDRDYYTFTLSEASDVDIFVQFTHLMGDIDIVLLTANDDSLALGVSTSDNEEITIQNLDAGQYYLLVYGFGGTVENNYEITINQAPAGSAMNECMTDEQCPWDYTCSNGTCVIPMGFCEDEATPNQTIEQAFPVTKQTTLNDLTFCAPDFFSIELAENEEVTFRVSFDNIQGEDLDIKLYRPNGSPVRYGTTVRSPEEINYTAFEAGVHILEVYGYFGFSDERNFITSYTLEVE
jgi:hypothetical protein